MDNYLRLIYIWYESNKRTLPWRETTDPYLIWLSEIILQQTRISQGTSYYLKFIHKFPDIKKLASASEGEVLKLWQGLGYYSRARNLHEAAKQVVGKYNGIFPGNIRDISALKGVGPYTASAIGSIAFGLPYPAVDGNVYRFLSRFFGIAEPIDSATGKKIFYRIAEEILDKTNPGNHNQALMEFGALQCVPRNPECFNCPVKLNCFAFENGKIAEFPFKLKKTKQAERFFFYFLIENGDSIYLQKREKNDIWKNLYELPLVEVPDKTSIEEFLSSESGGFLLPDSGTTIMSISNEKKHQLSHQKIFARFIQIKGVPVENLVRFIRVNKKDIHKFAIPRLIENYFEEVGLAD